MLTYSVFMSIPLPVLDLRDCDPASPLRAFIGLWPDEGTRAYLQEQARLANQTYGGRQMLPEHFHLTLAFLDSSPVSALRNLAAQMPDWVEPEIAFDLNIQGVFVKPQVVWAGPDQTQQQALDALLHWHEDIWDRLLELGWMRSERRFRPHVSLLRHARLTQADTQEHALPRQPFGAAGVGLVVSVPGPGRSQYHVAACLGGAKEHGRRLPAPTGVVPES